MKLPACRGQSKKIVKLESAVITRQEARKTETFGLRQKAQSTLPQKTLVSDGWFFPIGVAILALH